MEKQKWYGKTMGNQQMHEWLIQMLRFIDVRIIYIFVAIFVIPFFLIFNPSCGITYRYFRKRIGFGRLKSAWKTYVNHCLFGQVVVDKFAMFAGKKFVVETDGYEHFVNLASQEEGFIQLSAHFGNYEIAGYTLVADRKQMNALVFAGEKEEVMRNRSKMFEGTNISMIPIKQDMSHLFLIDNALQKGEIISMPADRILGSPRYLEHPFLGEKARFPMGPFSLATMRGLNVLSVNVVKTSLTKYKAFIVPLNYDKHATRKAQITELANAYVTELESKVRQNPEQWYNYFEFWPSAKN